MGTPAKEQRSLRTATTKRKGHAITGSAGVAPPIGRWSHAAGSARRRFCLHDRTRQQAGLEASAPPFSTPYLRPAILNGMTWPCGTMGGGADDDCERVSLWHKISRRLPAGGSGQSLDPPFNVVLGGLLPQRQLHDAHHHKPNGHQQVSPKHEHPHPRRPVHTARCQLIQRAHPPNWA